MMNHTEDFRFNDGSEVKSLPDGRLTGCLIRFSSPGDPDLGHDFFDGTTDYGFEETKQSPVYLNHRKPFKSPGGKTLRVKDKIGESVLTKSDDGILIEAILYNHEKYRTALHAMGWSSGTAGHLVDREKVGKAFHVKSWPLGLDASLTWEPCEPRNMLPGSLPLKSLEITDEDIIDVSIDEFLKSFQQDEFDQQFSIDGIPSIKSFCEAVAPMSLKDGSHRSQSAADAAKEFITIAKILGEAYDSYTSRLVKRTEHRFLKEGRELDASTVSQVEKSIEDIEQIIPAIDAIKASLLGIRKLSEMTKTEQKAMDQKARFALWNYYRISGTTPDEETHNGRS